MILARQGASLVSPTHTVYYIQLYYYDRWTICYFGVSLSGSKWSHNGFTDHNWVLHHRLYRAVPLFSCVRVAILVWSILMDESELVRSGSDLLRGLLKKFLEFVVSESHHTIS